MKDIKDKYEKRSMTFKKMSKIDPNNLAGAMAKNASNMFFVGEAKAEAEYKKNQLESRLKITKAKVDKAIRATAPLGKKPSENEIKSRIAKHSDVVEVVKQLNEATYVLNLCWTAVGAIGEKGKQLTNMTYNRELQARLIAKSRKEG